GLALWKVLRNRFGNEEPAAVMKRVRDVMDGKTTGDDLAALIAQAEQDAVKLPPEERETGLIALGEAALAAGQEDLGKGLLEKAAKVSGSPAALIRLGDFLAGKKLWEQAADCYERAWKKDQKQPLPLYLRGWALAQGGAEKEGRQLMDLSHWLPL